MYYLKDNHNRVTLGMGINPIITYNDKKIPAVLYKYRSFQNKRHLGVLYKRELYLSSPNDFSDSYDCNLEEKVPPKNTLIKEYLRHLPSYLRNASQKEKENYAIYMAQNGLFAYPDALKSKARELNCIDNKRRGVLSLTKRWNNEYMWNNYGDNHQGFCVGFNSSALFNTAFFGGGGDVYYCNELPQLDSNIQEDINIIRLYFAKKDDYKDEEEFRFIKTWNYDVTDKERIVTIPVNCFECIIMGKNMQESNKKKIKEMHKQNFPDIKLYELIDE